MSNIITFPPLAYSVQDAVRVTTISRPRIYQLINQGKLKASKIGRRTVIRADSLQKLIDEGC